MKQWVLTKPEYIKAAEELWAANPVIQILLGAKNFEKLLTDFSYLIFKNELPCEEKDG